MQPTHRLFNPSRPPGFLLKGPVPPHLVHRFSLFCAVEVSATLADMVQPLFLVPDVEFEKTAGGEEVLSDDPNQWTTEVMQALYKQFPAASDFAPMVTMEKVDGERGYGFGSLELANQTEIQHGADPAGLQAAGVQRVKVPVIIRDKKLQPLDLMVTANNKLLPLTENRLRQTIFRPQAFDITGRGPGDMSMIGQLYPPYRQNYGFGGGGATMNVGMGKEGSAFESFLADAYEEAKQAGVKKALNLSTVGSYLKKQTNPQALAGASHSMMSRGAQMVGEGGAAAAKGQKYLAGANIAATKATAGMPKAASVLSAILPTVSQRDYDTFFAKLAGDTGLQRQLVANGHATGASIQKLAEFVPETAEKTAAAARDGIVPTVLQLQKAEEGYLLKTASHEHWAPVVEHLDRGQAFRALGAKVVLAADESGAATMSVGQPVAEPESPEADTPMRISTFGMYKVQDEKGRHLVGYVFPNLIDTDGTSLPIALFTNGSQYAVQGDIAGVHAGHGGSIFEGTPQGSGCFYHVLSNGKAEATVPMTVKGSINDQENGVTLQCVTYDGREVQVVVQKNIQAVMPSPDGDHLLIPDTFSWLPLDKAEDTKLVEQPEGFNKEAQAKWAFSSVTVRGGGGAYSVSGFPVEKLAAEDRSFLSVDDTMFLLAGLGTDMDYAQKKLGQLETSNSAVELRVAHYIHPFETKVAQMVEKTAERLAPLVKAASVLRKDLLKEAAVIPDPTAVDTVLSLGFLNAENLGVFISYLPKIDEAQEKICELLLAARLGLRNIPVPALEKAMRTVEEVLEGLHELAFTST